MPVNSLDFSNDSVGPFNRLSASQVILYEGCNRQWFYEKALKFKIPQVPVMYVGKAVEEAFCRVLMESPFLISSAAHRETMQPTPLDDNGRPSTSNELMYPAEHLLPLEPHERPQTLNELRTWASSRINVHAEHCLEQQRIQWEKHVRRVGDWQSVNYRSCIKMIENALDFHFEEVSETLATLTETRLHSWRNGHRPTIPNPDGFGVHFRNPRHPFAQEGPLNICEAWEISRPWFVDPNTSQFSMNAIHPEFWFQGEYDLVYRKEDYVKIVDLKASEGSNFRSEGYVQQLRMYAMLWHVTHDYDQIVDELEIWYVGHPSKKSVSVPTQKETLQLERELKSMFDNIKMGQITMDQCSPSPKAIRLYRPGGIDDGISPKQRCDSCTWHSICPSGTGEDPIIPDTVQLSGSSGINDITPLSDVIVRINIHCDIFSVHTQPGSHLPKIRVQQGQAFAEFNTRSIKEGDSRCQSILDLKKGDSISIENAILQSTHKGELVIKFDVWTQLTIGQQDLDYTSLLSHRTRWNICGNVAYTYEKGGISAAGKPWSRKGVVIFDNTHSIQIEGWDNQWGPQFELLEQGNRLAFVNLSLDAWAAQLKGEFQHNTSFVRL